MKPVDPSCTQAAPATPAAKTELEGEAHAALAQRLWQVLSQVQQMKPDVLDLLTPVGAAAELTGAQGASSTQSHGRAQGEREGDATAALTSAAYLLATSIQQLGIARYDSEAASAAPPLNNPQLPFTVRVGDVDANGGNASIDILHPLLGDIAIDVELQHGAARVSATVATEYGAQILQQGQAVLAERLLLQGITLQALDILVRRKRKNQKHPQASRKRTRREES